MEKIKSILRSCLILVFVFGVITVAQASETDGTIIVDNPNAGYAWSDQIGWVNFGITGGNIHITDSGITGNAWNSNMGWINMAPTNGGVTVATNGVLSGYAWSTNAGWVNFSGAKINSAGKFTGVAGVAGSPAGQINFNCANCTLATDWRPASARTQPTALATAASPSPLPSPSSSPAAAEEILPDQLFDIRLLLDQPSVARIGELIARVTFESFGREPTPVNLSFSILDRQKQEVWQSQDTTTVETEAVFVKRFLDAPNLADGEYTLRLKTLYNVNVEDSFEAPFVITSAVTPVSWIWWLIIVSLLLLLALVIIKRRRLRRQEEPPLANRHRW